MGCFSTRSLSAAEMLATETRHPKIEKVKPANTKRGKRNKADTMKVIVLELVIFLDFVLYIGDARHRPPAQRA
jgi:hypothetical protein